MKTTTTAQDTQEIISEVRMAVSTYTALVSQAEEWLEALEGGLGTVEEIAAQRMKARVLRMALSDFRGCLGS